jgi:hypothetical protein
MMRGFRREHMKIWTMVGAALVVMSGVGAAMAQAPAAPTAAPPVPQAGPMGGPGGPDGAGPMGERGGWGMRHGRAEMMRHMGPPPSKAAHFRLRRGDALIDVKCADDEPMKACVDAASVLLDKAAAPK